MITYSIIGFTTLISIMGFSNPSILEKLIFNPSIINSDHSEWHRFISHGFIHANIAHLFFNMLSFYFFGSVLEGRILTESEFIFFYISALVVASLPTYQKQKNNPEYKALGASGAVSATMFALVLYSPWSVIYLKFVIPIYFVLFAVGYLIYSSFQSKNSTDNIAHDVHLWGALYGICYMLLLHPESFRIFLDKIQHPPF